MITLTLPYPPTANNLFFNRKKGRVRTPAYDAWIAEALAAVTQQQPGKVDGPFRFWLHATRPDKRRRDIDNLVKPTLDLLKKAGVVADDCLAESINATWKRDTYAPGAPINVIVEAC